MSTQSTIYMGKDPMRRSLNNATPKALLAIAIVITTMSAFGARADATSVVSYSAGLSAPGVWAMDGNGSSRRELGPGEHPIISPGGALVAAEAITEQGTPVGEVVIYSVSGGEPIRIALHAERVSPLAFSRDSRYLAVSLFDGSSGRGLAVIDVEAGTVTYVSSGTIDGASFDPQDNDELVFGRCASGSPKTTSPVNLYTWLPNEVSPKELTADGRSMFPIWGPGYIAYAHERKEDAGRGSFAEMQVQIWLRRPNGSTRQLTHMRLNYLQFGLVPIAISASGTHMAAELEEQDLPMAMGVDVPSGSAHVLVRNAMTHASGISTDGSHVLVWQFDYNRPDQILDVPFGGGHATVLLRQRDTAEPTWSE
jgi:hypothetical protein